MLVAFFAVLSASAQNASVRGLVMDPSGAAVRGAQLTLLNEKTGISQSAKSNGTGFYSFSFLQPGIYTLNAESSGFKKYEQTHFTLSVAQDLSIEVHLQIGSESQSVIVDGSGASMNTTDASVSTVVDRQFVENMPLNGRSFQSLLTLVPGVSVVPAQGGPFSSSGSSVGYGGEISVNGQRTEANYFIVDGVSVNTGASPSYNLGNGAGVAGGTPGESVLGTTQSMVSIDALEEFRATTSTYSAEYGRTPGGQFSFITRSGTNQWHGSLFDYLRNDAFDANNWFNDNAGVPKSAEHQNDFGGTLGGPVIIPRFYNGKDRTFFFFSYEGLRLSAPQAAIVTDVPSLSLRANSPAAIQPFLNAFPQPSQKGRDLGDGLAEFISGCSNPSSLDSISARVDHSFNDKFKVFARYGHSPSNASFRYTSDLAVNTPDNQAYDTITLGTTNIFTPSLSNDFRFNFTRNDVSIKPYMDNFGGADPIAATDLPGLVSASQMWFFLYWDLDPEIQLAPESNTQHQINVTDSFNAVRGRHTWKWGIDYRRLANSQSIPVVQESGVFYGEPEVLSNLADYVTLWTFGMPVNPVYENFSVYGQDEWKVNVRLNVSLGLRWELNPAPHDALGNNPYTVTSTDVATMLVAPKNTPLWQTTYHNFAPRVGIAYQLHPSPAYGTVLRAGGGWFYDTGNTQGSIGYNGLGQGGISEMTGVSFPATQAQIDAVPAASAAAPYNNCVLGFNPHLRLPYSIQWNLAVEQGLGEKQTLTLNYVGAADRQLLMEEDVFPATVGNEAFSQNWGVQLVNNGVSGNYNALQVRFQSRLSHGLQSLVSYTWSHSIDDATSNFLIYELERADSDNDIRQMLNAALTYEVPGSYQNRLLSSTLKNWSLDLRLSARSALPVDVLAAENLDAATGQFVYYHPNVVPDQPLYLQNSAAPGGRVINYEAFSPATDSAGNGIEGDLGRNALRGFDAVQADIALRREFHLGEKANLQFRAEGFNILNHPIFGSIYNELSQGPDYFGYASNTLNNQLGGLSSLYQVGGPRSLQLALRLHF